MGVSVSIIQAPRAVEGTRVMCSTSLTAVPWFSHVMNDRHPAIANDWGRLARRTNEIIASLGRPLGHGTRSENLANIIVHDLLPAPSSYRVDIPVVTACDLRIPDAALDCLLHATKNDTSSLGMSSKVFTGKDVFSRLAEVNPKLQSRWRRALARMNFKSYQNTYARQPSAKGYPVILVYDGTGAVNAYPKASDFPADVWLPKERGTLRESDLHLVFAPANRIAETETLLKQHSLTPIEVFPLELFELDAILAHQIR